MCKYFRIFFDNFRRNIHILRWFRDIKITCFFWFLSYRKMEKFKYRVVFHFFLYCQNARIMSVFQDCLKVGSLTMFHFYTPWKTSENLRFSDFAMGYRSGTFVKNELTFSTNWSFCNYSGIPSVFMMLEKKARVFKTFVTELTFPRTSTFLNKKCVGLGFLYSSEPGHCSFH